jgi:nucleoid DNA-binding protein
VPKKQMSAMVEVIAKPLKKSEPIRISGLGIIQVRKRPARMGSPRRAKPSRRARRLRSARQRI